MFRRLSSLVLLLSLTWLTPAQADTWDDCLNVPECVRWIEYQTALARWYEWANLNAWYLAVDRSRNPCDDDWPLPAYIVWRESRCRWDARSTISTAGGFAQMIQSTANNAALAIGHPELVGINAAEWAPHLQEQAVNLLVVRDGLRHWDETR